MEGLQRLAKPDVAWAHAAARREAPLLWIAASGLEPEFAAAIRRERGEVYLWDLEMLYDAQAMP